MQKFLLWLKKAQKKAEGINFHKSFHQKNVINFEKYKKKKKKKEKEKEKVHHSSHHHQPYYYHIFA